jgi:hypothetical protein
MPVSLPAFYVKVTDDVTKIVADTGIYYVCLLCLPWVIGSVVGLASKLSEEKYDKTLRNLSAEDEPPNKTNTETARAPPYGNETGRVYANSTFGFLAVFCVIKSMRSVGWDLDIFVTIVESLSIGIGFSLQHVIGDFVSGMVFGSLGLYSQKSLLLWKPDRYSDPELMTILDRQAAGIVLQVDKKKIGDVHVDPKNGKLYTFVPYSVLMQTGFTIQKKRHTDKQN